MPIRIIESPDEAAHARDREQKSDQHEADDLAAQRKAADAADRSAATAEGQIVPTWISLAVAGIGTAIAVGGTWLLYLNLIEARKTARAGIDAAGAALEANRKELRAYMTFSKCVLDRLHTETPKATAYIKNTGQFPAPILNYIVEWQCKIDGTRRHAVLENRTSGIIARDDDLSINLYLPVEMLTGGHLHFPPGAKLYLSGRVEYFTGHTDETDLAIFDAEFTFSRIVPNSDTMKISGSTIDEIYDAPLREARRAHFAAKAKADENPQD